ncbi:50S ribosomal protein L18 [Candidatus Jorgensenbacteria bacterium RIFCSPLOWO2_02_FULL_45_12]|uniref:Large ribosomal subunit protein uL18 n=2 Tax=Candidatus Joergenseniibacteriota TaxID=1752739 RepID=A0A1F6BQ20_9BACT|nr:MAG: 50S ribosomal protein L18 [Candidatus Jorgensenbacteria bacterium GW2011_GWA2_45_9]OGG38943.1 MAG: 50S ribosomal protein L18 [Candidatus Jorgensenbacteria bacterium RIFCSPHIGHO2_02_FULL_45_20]OGG42702.1 MAG: 50S ribosomal protein L18 [Candidatus Jorgensenbacteria bacterium RIFCSPLOWO2_02_FULL_45_12]
MDKKSYNAKKNRRAAKIRKTIGKGTKDAPRLSVFRSNTQTYAQLIDDSTGKTLVSASSNEIKGSKKSKLEAAKEVGKMIAEKALKSGITKAVFDRGRYKYHGRVKALAEGARESKLIF